METTKLYVGVHAEITEGKVYFKIDATEGIVLSDLQKILVGGLNLSIRGERTPELQGKKLREIIYFMESEFVNVDSFNDVHIGVPNT